MNTPRVSIGFSNGNLLKEIAAIDGYSGLLGTAQLQLNKNKVFTITSLADAVDQGLTLDDEPDAYKHLKEFFTELGGNQKIYVLLADEDITMTEMLDSQSGDFAKKLLEAGNGEISLVGIFRTPPLAYDPGNAFYDADVASALTAAQSLGEAINADHLFSRFIIAGRIADEGSNDILDVKTLESDYANALLGDTKAGKEAAIGLLLGRKQRYAGHIKIGKVANGALSADKIFIGTKELGTVANLDTLHGKGVISFVTYRNKAGFFFGIDKMANTGDYRLLVYCAVVDAAARIANIVFTEDLEGQVQTNADGTITDLEAKHLEDRIAQQVAVSLSDRISGFEALVNRTVNIINTGRTEITLRVRPDGYLTFIEIDLGLTSGN